MLSIITQLGQSVREAALGRTEPSQLAWGVAFGVLLGIVPHTNLLTIALVTFVIGLRLNHGVAAGVAVMSAMFSTLLDPVSHQVGQWALTNEDWSTQLADFWQLPFIPWTDLNHTVVMGSLILGTSALLPIFLLSYPLFHLFTASVPPVPRHSEAAVQAVEPSKSRLATAKPNQFTVVQSVVFEPITDESPQKLRTLKPHAIDAALDDAVLSGLAKGTKSTGSTKLGFASAASPESSAAAETKPVQVIETRIDVIRLAKRKGQAKHQVEAADISKQDQPMSEALQYLLRQARDQQDRRAA